MNRINRQDRQKKIDVKTPKEIDEGRVKGTIVFNSYEKEDKGIRIAQQSEQT